MTSIDELESLARETLEDGQPRTETVELLGYEYTFKFKRKASTFLTNRVGFAPNKMSVHINPAGRGKAEWVSFSLSSRMSERKMKKTLWMNTLNAMRESMPFRWTLSDLKKYLVG